MDREDLKRLQGKTTASTNPETTIGEAINGALGNARPTPEEARAAGEARERQVAAMKNVVRLSADLDERYAPGVATFAAYEIYHEKQRMAVNQIEGYLDELKANLKRGAGLILYGVIGTGKDHLLAAALYAAAKQGFSGRWSNGQELYSGVRDTMDAGKKESEWLATWATTDILGISDPLAAFGELNAWRQELLYRLVDKRYRKLKATWITMNALTPQDADKKLSQQVFDRLQENAVIVPCFWPSYRERKKS